MRNIESTLIVFASEDGARLAELKVVEGHRRMEQVGTFTNEWKAPRRERPTSLSSPKTEHSYGSLKHVDDEHHRQYAAHLSQWLEGMLRQHAAKRLLVFAPPQMHGWLRKAYTPNLALHLCEGCGDFAHTNVHDLVDHPAVKAMFT